MQERAAPRSGEASDCAERTSICDVLRSVAKQNMGERRQERTAYTVLSDPNDTERSGVHESAAWERTLFTFSFFFKQRFQILIDRRNFALY